MDEAKNGSFCGKFPKKSTVTAQRLSREILALGPSTTNIDSSSSSSEDSDSSSNDEQADYNLMWPAQLYDTMITRNSNLELAGAEETEMDSAELRWVIGAILCMAEVDLGGDRRLYWSKGSIGGIFPSPELGWALLASRQFCVICEFRMKLR